MIDLKLGKQTFNCLSLSKCAIILNNLIIKILLLFLYLFYIVKIEKINTDELTSIHKKGHFSYISI
jgi:hypothetical protein